MKCFVDNINTQNEHLITIEWHLKKSGFSFVFSYQSIMWWFVNWINSLDGHQEVLIKTFCWWSFREKTCARKMSSDTDTQPHNHQQQHNITTNPCSGVKGAKGRTRGRVELVASVVGLAVLSIQVNLGHHPPIHANVDCPELLQTCALFFFFFSSFSPTTKTRLHLCHMTSVCSGMFAKLE